MKIDLTKVKYYMVSVDIPKYIQRRSITLKELAKINIHPEIIHGLNENLGGWYGFFTIMMKEIGREVFTPFVILEDDVKIHSFQTEVEIPDSSDALWLGHSLSMTRYKRINNEISQIFNMGSLHAVLFLTKDFCLNFRQGLELANKFKVYWDIPTKICQELYETYTMNIPMFYQSDSEIDERQISETRFILTDSNITDSEYANWKKYRRIDIDPLMPFKIDHEYICWKLHAKLPEDPLKPFYILPDYLKIDQRYLIGKQKTKFNEVSS